MKKILNKNNVLVLPFLLLGSFETAFANEIDNRRITSHSNDEWQFSITPYIWASDLEGNLGHRSVGTHAVKANFSKILKNINFMAMVQTEARKGDWSFHTDWIYLGSNLNYDLPSRFASISRELKTKGSIASGSLGIGYTFYETPKVSLQVIAGAKAWHANIDFDLYANHHRVGSGKENGAWVDALGGIKGQYRFNDKFAVDAFGMWGKGAAKSDWDISLLANWSLSRDISLVAGYRMIKVDLNRRGFTYDIKHKGPMFGIKIDF